jgi:hypothetical protein
VEEIPASVTLPFIGDTILYKTNRFFKLSSACIHILKSIIFYHKQIKITCLQKVNIRKYFQGLRRFFGILYQRETRSLYFSRPSNQQYKLQALKAFRIQWLFWSNRIV